MKYQLIAKSVWSSGHSHFLSLIKLFIAGKIEGNMLQDPVDGGGSGPNTVVLAWKRLQQVRYQIEEIIIKMSQIESFHYRDLTPFLRSTNNFESLQF
jgi:hypothetical protein